MTPNCPLTKPQKLSAHCIDKSPCNPDEPLVYCPSCQNWLHARCLEEQAVTKAEIKSEKSRSVDQKAAGKSKSGKKGTSKPPTSTTITAKLSTSAGGNTLLTVSERHHD